MTDKMTIEKVANEIKSCDKIHLFSIHKWLRGKILSDLESCQKTQDELIEALIENIKTFLKYSDIHFEKGNIEKSKINSDIAYRNIKKIESITGKKWEEINV